MANRFERSHAAADAGGAGRVRVRRGAKALIGTPERALLVRERHADGSPFWTFPGGGVHDHESLFEGLARELREELQCGCVVGDSVTSFWYAHSSLSGTLSRYTVFECTPVSEIETTPREGVLGCRWVNPTNPPAATLPQVRHVLESLATE